ncbi:hypothetical protein BRADI_1g22885v3 [Brachypodium distachyon]|uniref:Uncharacterized protein n=1 Tax=Brachypodium distachyon TaxID=15368 RepID=A0A0Q3JTQ7_BRADI|nr:hypothetical protein BRADI_1g22885v3 [Brachypodium distachyon]
MDAAANSSFDRLLMNHSFTRPKAKVWKHTVSFLCKLLVLYHIHITYAFVTCQLEKSVGALVCNIHGRRKENSCCQIAANAIVITI